MAWVVVAVVVASLLVLWGVAWLVSSRPACPWCGSKQTEYRGGCAAVAFRRCRRCLKHFDVKYLSHMQGVI